MFWKDLLMFGHQAERLSDLYQAEKMYSMAMDLLAPEQQGQVPGNDDVEGWVAVHHGLSSVYEALGDDTLAVRYLMLPFRALIAELEADVDDCRDIRLQQALSHSLVPLLSWASTKPMCSGCQQWLERGKALITKGVELH